MAGSQITDDGTGGTVGWFRGVDVRQSGSGNIGATNVTRVAGKKLGAVVLLLDALKGALAVALALWLQPEAPRLHAAVGLALIGLLGTLGRLVPAIAAGQLGRPAVLAQLAMSVILVAYIALGVKSFKEARRARLAR